jgi:uncharacterized protein YeaC (DUF1315 family)
MSRFIELIRHITPDVYQSLKLAVEIGKWADGRPLTQEQRELSLQALIAWEAENLPEEQRIGYMGDLHCASKSEPIPNVLYSSSESLH